MLIQKRECPSLTASAVPTGPEISATAPWNPAPPAPPLRASSNPWMYNPALGTAEEVLAFRQTIHANQFPADLTRCNRSLILYDDAMTAGLGYSARLLGRALLVAVREQRVLINAPHPTARWCGRPPYTLACHYEAWTHCPMPTNLSLASKWSHRAAFHDGRDLEPTGGGGKGKGKGHGRSLAQRKVAKSEEPDDWYSMVRISTSQVLPRPAPPRLAPHAVPSPKPVAAPPCDHRPTVWPPPLQIFKENFFYKFHQPPAGEAALFELLFRPRKWVREAARCALRQWGRGAARLTARPRAEPIRAPLGAAGA